MRRNDDLMERLAAADPMPRAERLTADERHEADELLARVLATPPDEHVAPRLRLPVRRPRRLLVAGAIACGAAIVVLAADLLGAGGPGSGVIDRAVAAVTRADSVYHVVMMRRGTGTLPGAEIGPFRVESWRASDGRMHEKVSEPGGRLLEEVAGRIPPDGKPGPLLRYDPTSNTAYGGGIAEDPRAAGVPALDPAGDPAATLAELHDEGLLELDGETTVEGRRAYRLVSDPISRGEGEQEHYAYLVDGETHLPLEQRYEVHRSDGVLAIVTEFRAYERLPIDAGSTAQLDLDPHPGMRCEDGAADLRGLGFPNPCVRR